MNIGADNCSRLLYAQWCLLLLWFSACVFLLWGVVEEDSYIFFRVARNIAEGYGYVFNRGGELVETGSSPLWQLFMAAAALTPLPMITLAKLMGSISALLCLWHGWKVERHFGSLPILFSPFLLGTSITFLFWSQSGMETVFFALLVILLVRSLLDPQWHRHAAWLAILLYVGRPEGFIYLPAMAVAFACVPGYRPYFFRQALWVAAGISAFHACRWWYFDDIFPSAFYAKSDFYPIPHHNLYKTYLVNSQLYWLLPAILFSLFRIRSLVVLWVFLAACYFAAGNPDGKILFRLGLPAVASACLLAAIGIQLLFRFLSDKGSERSGWVVIVLSVVLVVGWSFRQITFTQSVFYQQQDNPLMVAVKAFVAAPGEYFSDTIKKMVDPGLIALCNKTPVSLCEENGSYNDFGEIGHWLSANSFPGMVVAGDQMGEIPWTSGQEISHLDLFGIADKCIGYANFSDNVKKVQGLVYYSALLHWVKRKPVCDRQDAIEHFFSVRPDVIFLGTILDSHAAESFYGRLLADPRFRQQYALRYAVDLTLAVYVKNTLPDFSIPERLLLVDARSMKILNCPARDKLRKYLRVKLVSAYSDEAAEKIEKMCAPEPDSSGAIIPAP